ncbi:unnamed protein product [Ectocarpus fasciculatus]
MPVRQEGAHVLEARALTTRSRSLTVLYGTEPKRGCRANWLGKPPMSVRSYIQQWWSPNNAGNIYQAPGIMKQQITVILHLCRAISPAFYRVPGIAYPALCRDRRCIPSLPRDKRLQETLTMS